MVTYSCFCLTIFFASTLSAPSTSKRYRSDYQYNELTDAFYKLHIESRRGTNIKSVCEVEGASVMLPATQEDVIQAHGMFKRYPDLGPYLWVAPDDRKHESAEEQALINLSESDEEDWQPDQCDVLTRSGDIEVLECYRELPFVCKVEAKDAPYDPHCDVFSTDYHYNATVGSCYSIRRWAASWNEAYTECRAEGAHLVVLNSEAEMAVVHAYMKETPVVRPSRHPWYYFAGFRANKPFRNEPVEYRTIFNQTLAEAGYAGWSPGEPNNINNEYCGTLYVVDGMLNDVTCEDQYAFICEKEYHAHV